MKKLIIVGSILLLTSCASASSVYLGNGRYQVSAKGSGAVVSDEAVMKALIKEAHDICAKSGKGFRIEGMEDASRHGAIATSSGNANTTVYGNAYSAHANTRMNSQTTVTPIRIAGNKAIITCEGEIDPEVMAQFN